MLLKKQFLPQQRRPLRFQRLLQPISVPVGMPAARAAVPTAAGASICCSTSVTAPKTPPPEATITVVVAAAAVP